mmetsp:Transcript_29538/g.70369  ORF Transcript_29538/g.70369 Transcript_29538/m.70369 type:complete len:470 (-) Transcript_29538:1924-3333(-)
MGQPDRDVIPDLERFLQGEGPPAVDPLGEGAALDQLVDERHVRAPGARPEQPHDLGRVLELGHQVHLLEVELILLRGRLAEALREDLHGGGGAAPAHPVDLAKAAGPDEVLRRQVREDLRLKVDLQVGHSLGGVPPALLRQDAARGVRAALARQPRAVFDRDAVAAAGVLVGAPGLDVGVRVGARLERLRGPVCSGCEIQAAPDHRVGSKNVVCLLVAAEAWERSAEPSAPGRDPEGSECQQEPARDPEGDSDPRPKHLIRPVGNRNLVVRARLPAGLSRHQAAGLARGWEPGGARARSILVYRKRRSRDARKERPLGRAGAVLARSLEGFDLVLEALRDGKAQRRVLFLEEASERRALARLDPLTRQAERRPGANKHLRAGPMDSDMQLRPIGSRAPGDPLKGSTRGAVDVGKRPGRRRGLHGLAVPRLRAGHDRGVGDGEEGATTGGEQTSAVASDLAPTDRRERPL